MSQSSSTLGIEHGSAVVSIADIKLYNFCKLHIGSYSRRELRDYFLNGNIYVNGIRIRKGHDDETMRLSIGDVVCLKIVDEPMIVTHSGQNKLDLIYEGPGFCVFNKPTGCSVTDGKEYEVAIRAQLWNGQFADTSTLLYRLEKSIGGLSIAVQSHQQLVRLRKATTTNSSNSPEITLSYQALVCGWLGEEGETVSLETKYPDCPSLTLQVVKHCRCRSANFLSLVNVTPQFTPHFMGLDSIDAYKLFESDAEPGVDKSDWHTEGFLRTLENPVTNADYKLLNHPTRTLKAIRCALMRAGHGIVGDKDLVKKSKGLYAALTGLTLRGEFSDPSNVNVPLVLQLPTPEKFIKLMEREEKMWLAARDRDQAVLAEHRARVGNAVLTTHTNEEEDLSEAEQGDGGNDSESDGDQPSASSKQCKSIDIDKRGSSRKAKEASEGVPVEYITGEALFCGRRFTVSPAVMIPRRSSEALVKEAVRLSQEKARGSVLCTDKDVRVLDLGTGSGCLLLSAVLGVQAALDEISESAGMVVTGVGLDISTDALKIASKNILDLNLSSQVSLVEGSFESMLETLSQHHRANLTSTDLNRRTSFDIILCNPPYSSYKDKSRLSVACRTHEPAVALFAPRHSRVDVEGGSEEGTMGAYYMIARSLAAIHHRDTSLRLARCDSTESTLSPQPEQPLISLGAHMIVEMGHGQESDVRRILSTGAQGWKYLHSVRDHLEIVRCVVFEYVGVDITEE